MAAFWLSLRTSVTATLLCVVLGVPMAVVLARTGFRGHRVLRSLVLLPLVLPPVVGGIALLYTFGRRGLLGQAFDALGDLIEGTRDGHGRDCRGGRDAPASFRIRRVGARAAVHAAQFNGKQEPQAPRAAASLRCPRNGPADGVPTTAPLPSLGHWAP